MITYSMDQVKQMGQCERTDALIKLLIEKKENQRENVELRSMIKDLQLQVNKLLIK
jgi:hypothetical protein